MAFTPYKAEGTAAASPADQKTLFQRVGEGAKELGKTVITPFVRTGVTGLSVLDSGYKLATGDVEGANRTLREGYDVWGLGQIKPHKIGIDVEEQAERGIFGRETLGTLATGAEVGSFFTGGRAGVSAVKTGARIISTPLRAALAEVGISGFTGAAGGEVGRQIREGEHIQPGRALASGIVGAGLGVSIAGAAAGGGRIWRILRESQEAAPKAAGATTVIPPPEVPSPGAPPGAGPTTPIEIPNAQKIGIRDNPNAELFIDDARSKALAKVGIEPREQAIFQGSTGADVAKMREMVNAAEDLNINPLARKRPEHVLGQSIISRAKTIYKGREDAGKALGEAVKVLPKDPIDVSQAQQFFLTEMRDQGVRIMEGGALNFDNSRFKAKSAGQARSMFQQLYNDISSGEGMTPSQIRTTRQWLFDDVIRGKRAGAMPLTSTDEYILNKTRELLDEPLQSLSPTYKEASRKYAISSGAMEELNSILGKPFTGAAEDIKAMRAGDVGLGLLNTRNARTLNFIEELDDVARQFGYDIEDDLVRQAHFADFLEDLYELQRKRGFQAQVSKGVEMGMEGIQTAAELSRGNIISPITRFVTKNILRKPGLNERQKAIKELLAIIDTGSDAITSPVTPKGGKGAGDGLSPLGEPSSGFTGDAGIAPEPGILPKGDAGAAPLKSAKVANEFIKVFQEFKKLAKGVFVDRPTEVIKTPFGISETVSNVLRAENLDVSFTRRSLKHLSEKGDEGERLLTLVPDILSSPDEIRRGKSNNRFLISKSWEDVKENRPHAVSLEVLKKDGNIIITTFQTDAEYLSGFELLWRTGDSVATKPIPPSAYSSETNAGSRPEFSALKEAQNQQNTFSGGTASSLEGSPRTPSIDGGGSRLPALQKTNLEVLRGKSTIPRNTKKDKRGFLQGLHGATAGLEVEQDEKGNIKGIKFNPEKAMVGMAGIIVGKKALSFSKMKHIEAPWEKGTMRAELSDKTARIKPTQNWAIKATHTWLYDGKINEPALLQDAFEHPKLYNEYPELKNVMVKMNPKLAKNSGFWDGKAINISDEMDEKALKPLILHEIQHVIQDMENFAPGGSIDELTKNPELQRAVIGKILKDSIETSKVNAKITNADLDKIFEMYQKANFGEVLSKNELKELQLIDKDDDIAEYYHRLAGEWEARRIAQRSELSQGQLTKRPFYNFFDSDVRSPEDIIVIDR